MKNNSHIKTFSIAFCFLLSACCFVLAVSFSACKKHCTLTEKEGYRIVGDDKNCYYEPIGEGSELVFEITSVEDLKNNLFKIKEALSSGKNVEIKVTGQLVTDNSQYQVLESFGTIRKEYGAKIKVNMNGNAVVPAKDGLFLNHETWTGWSKLTLDINNDAPGGAKGDAKWTAPQNELVLFASEGQGNGIFNAGPPQTKRTIEVQNDTELQAAPNEVIAYQGVYEELYVKFAKKFDFSNPGASALESLVGMEKQNMFEFHNGSSRIGPANDSIHMNYAAAAHRLNQLNALEATSLGGGKYIYLGTSAQASRDSLLSINNLVYRFPEANSDNMPNCTKEIPNVLHLVREKEDVRTMFSAQFLNSQYKGKVELRPASRPNLPWKEQNVVGVNSAFLDRYECKNPDIPAKQGINGPTVWSQTPLILGEYYDTTTGYLPGTPDGLNVDILNFGLDNESGKKIQANYEKTINITSPSFAISKIYSPNRNINMKIQTNEEKFKDGGKIIVDASFLVRQSAASNVPGTTANLEPDVIQVENLKIYVGPDMLESYFYWYGLTGGHYAFLAACKIVCTNCDLLVLEMPAGKECYNWQGGKGGQKSPKKPSAQYVKYQNQKTTFAGFGQKLFEMSRFSD